MLRLRVSYDSFGGKDAVVAFLFDHGLLRTTCPECHRDGKLEDVVGMEFPRLCCKCGYRRSSKNATVLDDHGIGDIPLFIFVVKCFLLRISTKAIVELSGAHEETVHKYLKVVRSVLCSHFESEARNPDFMFGGPGKIVEVDEAFISKRKYGRGRRQPKEGIWVVGITEVDDPTQRIDDEELLRVMKKREADREAAAGRRVRRRKAKTVKRHVHPLGVFNETRSQYGVIDGPAPWFESGDTGTDRMESHSRGIFKTTLNLKLYLSQLVSSQTEVVHDSQEIGFVVFEKMKQSV